MTDKNKQESATQYGTTQCYDDMLYDASVRHGVTNYFKRIEMMTEAMDKNDYQAMKDLNNHHRLDNIVRMQKYANQIKMWNTNQYMGVEEYTLHAHQIIITKEDILYIGERLGYKMQNSLSEYEQYLNDNEYVTYNIWSSIKGMSSIVFFKNKNMIEMINLSSILDGQINKKLITKMHDKYTKRHVFFTKILKPTLEYGTVDMTKAFGMFTFKPVYESIHDYHHCWKWVRHNINNCFDNGMFRKTIMGKDYQKRLVFCLITESVNNIDEFRKLYKSDCCRHNTSPLYPYCKVKYVNHDKTFSKAIRCPSIREWNSGLVYPF